jgi:hypothetical protein
MNHTRQIKYRALSLAAAIVALGVISSQMRADTGTCGGVSITLPFTDVPASSAFFCSIASAYISGLTDGTTATTYDPTQNVTRAETAEFVSRTLDQSLSRGSRRAALDQWWVPATIPSTAKTQVGGSPRLLKSDGADIWVAGGGVARVRASDGQLLGTWTGMNGAYGVLVARGRVFVTTFSTPGRLYSIDPTQPPGVATLVTELPPRPKGIAYDGSRIWIGHENGGVSIFRFICVTGACLKTVTAGFSSPEGILYDGTNIWVADEGDSTLKKLNSDGSIALSVPVSAPANPVFDGANIWVPSQSSPGLVTVVRVKDSAGNPLAQPFVLAILTGNGLNDSNLTGTISAAFDGQRVLVTNSTVDRVSLWKATDLTPLGSVSTGANSHPLGACSDGINFWIGLSNTGQLARF